MIFTLPFGSSLLQLKYSLQHLLLSFFQTSWIYVGFQWFYHFCPWLVFIFIWYTDWSGTANLQYASVKNRTWQVASRCHLSYLPRQNLNQLECLSMEYRIQSSAQFIQPKEKAYNIFRFFQLCVIFVFFFLSSSIVYWKTRWNFIISLPCPDVFWII